MGSGGKAVTPSAGGSELTVLRVLVTLARAALVEQERQKPDWRPSKRK